jgi:hypothetical protein
MRAATRALARAKSARLRVPSAKGVDQLVQAVLVDLQSSQQLPLGLVLPVAAARAADSAGPPSWRTTHSETSCSTGSASRPVLPQPPKFGPDAHT